ncbi:pilus assembly protein PilX [Polaromonas sp. YR568]|uniref:pilus assembly protein PilX n=1 Tax=Polaromonas sp. YR568 TaxID=1855301 RepID=UPI00398C0AA4
MTSKSLYFTYKFSLQKPVSGARGRANQKGASLLFALLALVALSLAAIGLVRSVNTGTLVLGNLGFKQDATRSADQATAAAVAWLRNNPLIQNADGTAGSGYYASTSAVLDVTGRQLTAANRALVNWGAGNCSTAATGTYASCALVPGSAGTVNGNPAEYIIFRLCSAAGDPSIDTSIICSSPSVSSSASASKKGELNYSEYARFTGAGGPFYRIVVKVSGARGTTSFTETIVHF